jgi:hypothetical protein
MKYDQPIDNGTLSGVPAERSEAGLLPLFYHCRDGDLRRGKLKRAGTTIWRDQQVSGIRLNVRINIDSKVV